MAQELIDANGSVDTTPTGPEPTAFIIGFDDTNDKKMNIKDSIRKFAPPKPDSIEKPRPVKSPTNRDISETNKCDMKEIYGRPKSHLNAKQLANRSLDSGGGGGDRGGNLSDSATYLINRMLSYASKRDTRNRSATTNGRNSLPPVRAAGDQKWRTGGEKDSGVSDDNKSEAGTYTLALDDSNVELETARKQIDHIFGVSDDNNEENLSFNSSPSASSLNSPTLLLNIEDSIGNKMRQLFPNNNNNKIINNNKSQQQIVTKDIPQALASQTVNSNEIKGTFTRTKRRPPTVEEMLHQNGGQSRVDDNKRVNDSVVKSVNSYSNIQHPMNDLSKVNNNNKTKSTYNNNNSSNNQRITSTSAPSTPRSPFTTRRVLQIKSTTNGGNTTGPESRRKNSWSHYSDADPCFDSDDDSSSHRSHNSGRDGASSTSGSAAPSGKLRFNRAFALRRARLGIDTPGADVNHKSSTKPTAVSCNAPGSRLSVLPPHKLPQVNGFNRGDGGRFSLRVSNSANTRPKPMQNSSRISSTSRENVNQLQRKASDPIGGQKSVVSNSRFLPPAGKSTAYSDTDHRIQSFSNNKGRSDQWSTSLRSDIHRHYIQKSPSFADRSRTASTTSPVSVVRDPPIGLPSTPPPQRRTTTPTKTQSLGYQSETPSTVFSSIPSQQLQHKPPLSGQPKLGNSRPGLELSALDGLVVSAIHQLSQKLRSNMRSLLESERYKHEDNDDITSRIDELVPQLAANTDQMRRSAIDNGVSVSRDLSAILKNLKKLEQSYDVLNVLLDPNGDHPPPRRQTNAFFVVDV